MILRFFKKTIVSGIFDLANLVRGEDSETLAIGVYKT